MSKTLDLAYLLITSYALVSSEPLPVSDGTLDRALQLACKARELPDWAIKELHFVEGRTGMVCLEVIEVIDTARKALLAEEYDSSYQYVVPIDAPEVHTFCLKCIDTPRRDAQKYGEALVRRLAEAKAELTPYVR